MALTGLSASASTAWWNARFASTARQCAAQLVLVHARHAQAPTVRISETVTLQASERLAQRGTRHAELGGQANLTQP